ncbi:MAG: 2OG-Fe(II) oxygenase [Nannocystaceae bacterium]
MTEDLQQALRALEAAGSFCVRRTLPVDDFRLEIVGCGAMSFPVSAAAARQLVGVAVQSPFGWRNRTITDLAVRDGWEIAKSKIKIDGRRWNPLLRTQLEDIRDRLGLPDTARLRARLDKLTIYGPGQFFKPHQDTEKSDHMIGTLLVVLPSHYTGGTLKIEHNGKKVEVRRTVRKQPKLDLVAFYSDCRHEVRPVKQGYRIALVYQLDLDSDRARERVADAAVGTGVQGVSRAVSAYFSTPQPVRYGRSEQTRTAEKLVYLLDHEYTPRNLDWSQLKHGDRLRGLALREAAQGLDLEAFVCLADVHEVWQCEPEMSSYRWRRSRWHDEDDEDDEDDGEHNPVSLVDSDIELRHWKDASGKAIDFEGLGVVDDEICFTTANDALEPFDSRYEGYMGNYGDTLDRWYHRAAVVLWPRSHAFRMLVKTAPAQAVQQLVDAFDDDGVADDLARQRLEHLLELWPRHSHGLRDTALSPVVLRLALAIDDPSSAAALLAPLAPRKVSLRSTRPLLALTEHYGAAWMRQVLMSWHEPSSSRRYGEPAWAVYAPQWLARLTSDDPRAGLELARFIVNQQWAELHRRLAAATASRSRSRYEPRDGNHLVDYARTTLQACTIVDARKPFRAAVDRLTADDSVLSPLELATVANDLAMTLDDEAKQRWALAPLLTRSREALESGLADLQRKDGDYTIHVPQTCTCHDCPTLYEYLRSSKITLEWPLAKERRRHIHGEIGRMGLPVTHVTRRQGSPHILVLTKTKQLFVREAALRRRYEQSLAQVEGHLAGWPASGSRMGKAKASGAKKVRKTRAKHR